MTVLLSLLLVAGCSDEPGSQEEETGQKGQSPPKGGARNFITLDLGSDITMKLVRIEAGNFTMGSSETEEDHKSNEGAQRQVTISKPFYMGVTEVTQTQYDAVTGKNPSNFQEPDNPVEQVSWDECVAFCTALSKMTGRPVRLPTEAEWEYACRAGTKTRYSFGNDSKNLGAHAWYKSNSDSKTHPAGQKEPNAWGLYDMHGNVWEWCSDWYTDVYVGPGTHDPKGPAAGSHRVLRGASWQLVPADCRAASRHKALPANSYKSTGFRVVVECGSGAE